MNSKTISDEKERSEKKILLNKQEVARVRSLFENWKAWLFFLSCSYIIGFSLWSMIQIIIDSISYKALVFSTPFLLFNVLLMIMIRGLMFCADGLVTSYLKSPFNQICYSINKLDGLPRQDSDHIVSLLTEVNEHLKETFKKFGITTITTHLPAMVFNFFTSRSSSFPSLDSKFFSSLSKIIVRSNEAVSAVSLLIPMALAYRRLLTIEKKIIEIENLTKDSSEKPIEDEETK